MTASRDTQTVAGIDEPGRKGADQAPARPREPLSTIRQLELLRDLQRLANERAEEESRIARALDDGLRAADEARESTAASIERQYNESRSQVNIQHEETTRSLRLRYEQLRDASQREYKGLREGVETAHSRALEEARSAKQEASWEAMTLFDALKGRPRERYQEAAARLESLGQDLAALERDATALMIRRRQWREFPAVEPSTASTPNHAANHKGAERVLMGRLVGGNTATHGQETSPDRVDAGYQRIDTLIAAARQSARALQAQRLPRLYAGGLPAAWLVLAFLAAAVPSGLVLGWQDWRWAAIGAGVAVVMVGGLLAWFWPTARRQSGQQFREFQQQLADARQAVRDTLEEARLRAVREEQTLAADRDRQLAESEQRMHSIVHERTQWKDSEIGRAVKTYPQRLAQLREELESGLAAANEKQRDSLALLTEERDRRAAENRQRYEDRCRELRAEHDRDWRILTQRWRDGLTMIRTAWDDMRVQCERLFPDWETTDYATWAKPTETSPAIRFGRVTVDLRQVKNGVPQDARLRPDRLTMELPALMTLDEHPVLLITAEDDGRRAGVDVLQSAMLRMFTAMPPGKVRFTILDPVGLGENFASFMHLADFDEQLIASRIWTDQRQIEEQLTRLTSHMETVLQKYLRNEFATIHEYNAQAGEVAEPFQVLVLANFPMNFSDAAVKKLVSVATSGPRCGVYTMIMVDKKQKMPANFDLKDLLANAVHLDWVAGATPPARNSAASSESPGGAKGRFVWRYPAFEHLPLVLDRPPSAERLNDVLRAAGRAAKDSLRVEVPFEQVAPAEEHYWNGDCAKELVVPIGRAGARRLQAVRLGKGTSQHLLVAGKTGSGKSTFLHALITNTALIYSPEQVEFYLIDFKKGVEFKTYAAHHLPHARVIAIESEREFGLSVLERLDGELKRRGDLFRAAGVQDLPDYRAHVAESLRHSDRESGTAVSEKLPHVMPRILLVIDEFQELFVEDDKLAQDAALLLDRLVRQGRAFGIHVLLGSQTLSGAYSLARSTTGQMAVRVALQCSETDAHLILPDERNDAARFLSRPGEAIYNDQNGLLAGNHPFQVVWLPEVQRIEYLKQIEAKSREFSRDARRSGAEIHPTIVFEGDQPADPADNVQLRALLERGPTGPPAAPQRAWLGASVAIKEPPAATFARHAGCNLLVVGAWDESALGVLTNAVLALAAQNRVRSEERGARSDNESDASRSSLPAPRFYILDGTRPEAPEAGTWQRIADTLPHTVVVGSQRDTPRIINELAAELTRREAAGEDDAPPLYLVVFNGGRFRDLRRSEDDFSFAVDRDKPPAPDKQWAEILRNGPAWGIFTLLWCDSYNNVNRMMDRMMLREFEMRVAFQMSAADSSSLLDTPAASRLNVHRGLFASEDLGTLEKFRPYGVPSAEWLGEVRRVVSGRTSI